MPALEDFLLAQHPWYAESINDVNAWPLTRAVMGRFAEDEVKRSFLPKGTFEPSDGYETRIALTQPTCVTPIITSSFAGAVFARPPEVIYGPVNEAGEPQVGPLGTDLETWSDNVDGMGSSLTELLESNSDEAIPMGLCGFFVDKPAMSADQAARIASVDPEDRNADGAPPRDIAGVVMPRVVHFSPENIVDWQPDEQGRPLWVKLAHEVTRRVDPMDGRETVVEFILIDRQQTRKWEAEIIAAGRNTATTASGTLTTPLPASEAGASSGLTFPLTEGSIAHAHETTTVTHGLGIVPFVPYYGGGRRSGLFQVRSLMDGCKRADLAKLNKTSHFVNALYLHNCPLLEIKTTRNLSEVIRTETRAVIVDPVKGEEVNYKSTPHESFESSMKAIKLDEEEAFRQAGAVPGTVADDGSPESGRAKQVRFKNTEARSLARISKDAADCHFDLLEIAARYLSPGKFSVDERAFEGSVRYPSRFDLADVAEIATQYTEMSGPIESETWHRGMMTRYALASIGDVSREQSAKIEDEIAGQEIRRPPDPGEVEAAKAEALRAGAAGKMQSGDMDEPAKA